MSRSELAKVYAGETVEWCQRELELTNDEVAQAVGANRRAVWRWKNRESVPTPEFRRELERLNQLRYLLETSFASTESARAWLHRPNPGLKGRTPIFAITEGELDEVLAVLGTVAAGGFR